MTKADATTSVKLDHGALSFHGDTRQVLAVLLANGFGSKGDGVDIDPPSDSGAGDVRQVQVGGASRAARPGGEDCTIGEQSG